MQCVWLWRPLLHRHSSKLRGPRRLLLDGRSQRLPFAHRRHFGLESIPVALLPPVVFGGLLVTLWTYKCLMMVVFQNKIIYMPSVPPFSRSEKVSEYASECRPVDWIEHNLQAADGTALKLLAGSITSVVSDDSKHTVILYFQGNASSLPPRLPYLSNVLKGLNRSSEDSRYTIVALSYRGYWKSKGRPSQAGIELDAAAVLQWVLSRYGQKSIVVWGQSIGAGVAAVSVSQLSKTGAVERISHMILETPFVDLKAMLIALYPQKFLPYRYLTPFLLSTWDSKTALERVGGHKPKMKILILEAGKDEIVPPGQAESLENVCVANGLEVERKVVSGALHTDVMTKARGRSHVVDFIASR